MTEQNIEPNGTRPYTPCADVQHLEDHSRSRELCLISIMLKTFIGRHRQYTNVRNMLYNWLKGVMHKLTNWAWEYVSDCRSWNDYNAGSLQAGTMSELPVEK